MRPTLARRNDFEFTTDTLDNLARLEERVAALKAKLEIEGRRASAGSWESVRVDPGPTQLPPDRSAAPTGRELYLRICLSKTDESSYAQREREIAMLWAIAIPLGFVPFSRYPLPGSTDRVFHYMGEWALLMDHLLGAGRGEEGWPAFCCAAMLDVGRWEGGRVVERTVQAHLHRMGFNVGAVDGIVGPATQGALKAAGLHSMQLSDVAQKIVDAAPSVPPQLERPFRGQLDLPGVDFSIHPYGQVRATKTLKGAELLISGAGRYVIDVRGAK